MVWVKSELAEELAVVAAWLSALVPWSISLRLGGDGGPTLVEVRFPFGLIRYLFGIEISGGANIKNPLLKTPPAAADYYAGSPSALPFNIWTAAAGVLLLAVLLSFMLYFFEAELAESSVDPVRVMGALILLSAVLLTASSYILQFGADPIGSPNTFPGTLLPVGVLLQYAFAYVLLRVDRVDDADAETPESSDPA
jgi:hypothetical protein